MRYDAIVIGGGAAGLFCAITAGKRGRRVLVIERNAQLGRKILISGGGRCNFTNRNVSAANFVSQNTHFCKSALARFTPADFIRLVKKHGIEYYEKKLGQLFCRQSSRQIVEMLEAECREARVTIRTGVSVAAVCRDNGYIIETDRGKFRSEKLVIASGGLSFPKVGATGFGLQVAEQFGLKIEPTRPSLVPMVLKNKTGLAPLAGVSFNGRVTVGKTEFRDDILFTHRGMSGPAILQASNYWKASEPVTIDALPDIDIDELFSDHSGDRRRLDNFLSQHLPLKAIRKFIPAKLAEKQIAQIGKKDIAAIRSALKEHTAEFSGTESYDRAEVMLGGVSTSELESNSMAVKKFSDMYFIGEAVDVTGWLGGYNFQWAWASGHAAGSNV